MKVNIKKKLRQIGLISLVSICLTGCNGITWEDFSKYTDNADSAFDALKQRNVDFIKELETAGFLSKSQASSWISNVESQCEAIEDSFKYGDEDDNADLCDKVLKSITKDCAAEADDMKSARFDENGHYAGTSDITLECSGCGVSYTVEGAEGKLLDLTGTCDEDVSDGNNGAKKCGHAIYEAVDNTAEFDKVIEKIAGVEGGKKFELFDTTQAKELQEALGRPIAVITNFDGDKSAEKLQLTIAILQEDSTGANELMTEYGLENVILGSGTNTAKALVQNIDSMDDATKKQLEDYLLSYCTKTEVTYLDVNTYDGQKRVDDNGTPYIFADSWASSSSATTADSITHVGAYVGGLDETNVLGKDLIITKDTRVAARIRVLEFNPDLISTLNGNKDNNGIQGKYYLTDCTEKYAIKLDYPLYKIDSIKTSDLSSKDWWCTISNTGLKMDLTDGEFYDNEGYRLKYNGDFDIYTNNSTLFWYSDKVDPNKSDSELIDMVIKQDADGNDIKVNVRPLVLKDYVELYYIKDSDGNGLYESVPEDSQEYWAAIGRRMRIKKFKGNADDINEFAQSLNLDGSIPDNQNFISLNKIADKTSGYGFYEDVAEKIGLGLSNDSTVQDALDGNREGTLIDKAGSTGYTEADTGGMGFKKDVYFTYINPTVCLGTKQRIEGYNYKDVPLAQLDYNKVYEKSTNGTYTCPTIYGMCIGEDPKTMNLVGGSWIGSTEADCTNITQWNTWLSSNNFSYNIPIKRLLDLFGIFIETTESSQSAITIDKEVIEIISQETTKTTDDDILRNLKTISRMFGILVIAYGLILMGAWAIDVNVYGGIKFLTILTGGKWVAVRDSDDFPEVSDQNKYYMDLKRLIMAVCGIIAIGCLLTFIDFYDLRGIINKYSSSLTETVKKLFIE